MSAALSFLLIVRTACGQDAATEVPKYTIEEEREALSGVWKETALYIDNAKFKETTGMKLTFFDRWAVLQYEKVLRPPGMDPSSAAPSVTARAKAVGGFPFLLEYRSNLAVYPRQMRLFAISPKPEDSEPLELGYKLQDGKLMFAYTAANTQTLGAVLPNAGNYVGKPWVHVLEPVSKPPAKTTAEEDEEEEIEDAARIVGRWREISISINGQWPPSDQSHARVTFGNDWLVFQQQQLKSPQLAAYSLDDAKRIKEIDWEVFSPMTGESVKNPGIYGFAGDSLIISQPMQIGPSAERPRKFRSELNDGVIKRIYQRIE
jgi:uncharacterized protein (TIGR03067 family)